MLNQAEQILISTLFLMPTWKWLCLGFVIFIGLTLRPFLQTLIKKLRNKSDLASSNQPFWRYLAQLETDGPVSWIALSLVWLFILDSLQIHQGWDKYLTGVAKIIFTLNLIRLAYRSIDAVGNVLIDLAAKTETSLDDQLAPFVSKTLKVLVLVLGGLIALQNFGVNVMSLLAGLGLGGLALALAAQDTAANLFGSITILLDAPFKVGDHIKIGDTEGLVTEVGFRSTRIKTFTNSLVTLPNAFVAKEKVENLGERQAHRIRQTLGLHYDTSPEKVVQLCDEIRYLLTQEPLVMKENFVVNFVNFNASTLDLLVSFHVTTTETQVEFAVGQKILLEIWRIAKKIGVEFAYPTQTVYLPKG
ncbi:MAG: mechanosensitive ion channel [Bdellovibrionales bacterium]|nr:mechanosensitive ion channel [Bdellovibrionales bacterium]